jgi:hypothetical protein
MKTYQILFIYTSISHSAIITHQFILSHTTASTSLQNYSTDSMCQSSKCHLHAQIPTFSMLIPNQLDKDSELKEFFHTCSTINIIILRPCISLLKIILLHIAKHINTYLQHLIHKIYTTKSFN